MLTWWAMLKCINASLCGTYERLCIPFDVNKMVDEEEPFWASFSHYT